MTHFKRLVLVLLGLWPLSACAISPGPEVTPAAMCNFVRYELEVPVPGTPPPPVGGAASGTSSAGEAQALQALGEDAQSRPSRFLEVLQSSLDPSRRDAPRQSEISESMLFLSGGSQNGAFGAGFLKGWSEASGGLPSFRVVTGISTGSIISTFAFLGDADTPYNYYQIVREEDVLNPFVSSGGSSLSLTQLPVVARRGAVGELQPLREKLRELFVHDLLTKVASQHAAGRKLFVAAVDIDTGKAVVFDMGEMAKRATMPGADFNRYQECYVEAIIASSSVPLAAKPTFIDNRMYIDGGARFGLITDEIGRLISEIPEGFIEDRPAVYAIVNGTLEIEQVCGKQDESLCRSAQGANADLLGAHKDWSLDGLAFRSMGILINQGYRFSTQSLLQRAGELKYPFHLARVEPDVAQYRHRLQHPQLGEGYLTCPEWRRVDVKRDRPLEFHPRFMRCLAAYGRERGRSGSWRTVAPEGGR